MLIKVLGSILIIGAAALFGIAQRSRFAHKEEILSDLVSSLEIMHSEISSVCASTNEMLDRICNVTCGEVFNFFNTCRVLHQKHAELPFELIWTRAVKENSFELSAQEIQTLLELGNSIGRYGSDETVRAIELAKRRLEGYLKSATAARGKLGKLYGNLSIISGIALVIILI